MAYGSTQGEIETMFAALIIVCQIGQPNACIAATAKSPFATEEACQQSIILEGVPQMLEAIPNSEVRHVECIDIPTGV